MAMAHLKDKYVITQFDGENFPAWSFRLRSILNENSSTKAIDNPNFATEPINAKIETKAQAIIISAVADSHLEYIRHKETAYGMYKNLEENFQKRSVRSKLFLRRKLGEMKFNENNKLKEFIVSMEEIFTQLSVADSPLTEEEKVNYILLSMPKSYENVVTALETMENLKYDFVKNRLLSEEENKKGNKSEEYRIINSFICYTCGKTGHKKFQCQERNRNQSIQRVDNTFRGHSYKQGNSNQGQRINKFQPMFFTQRPTQRNQQKSQNNPNRTAYVCDDDRQINNDPDYFIYWYVDSGCSDHLTNNIKYFVDYLELRNPKEILVAKNEMSLRAIGIGNIEFKTKINGNYEYSLLKNVLYVPELRKNLLSVSKMESHGLNVTFANGKVKVRDAKKNNRLILIGNKTNSLYIVKAKLTKPIYCNLAETRINNNMLNLWHRRFGHLGIKNLKLLKNRNLVNGIENVNFNNVENILCEQCVLGKMNRLPFNKPGYRAKHPLELVHSDVCGPMHPESWNGCKYMLTFIDDFTHFVMIYLIKSKEEVFEQFVKYYRYVTNHFNRNIKKLRTDNGREYVSNEFKQFCDNKGIQMQLTVPYNPEMNGVAERMNRTIMEKARTILIESGLNKSFWGEAVMYANYVTNRSPTVNREKTPSELWYGQKPDVSNFKAFGSIAYNYIPKEFRSKLDDKSKKLIMVGYCEGGYKLWDNEKRKTIAARNVLFDEKPRTMPETIKVNINDELKDDETELETVHNKSDHNIYEILDSSPEINDYNKRKLNMTARTLQFQSAEKRMRNTDDSSPGSSDELKHKRVTKPPTWHEDYEFNLSNESDEANIAYCLLTFEEGPETYEEAVKDVNWKNAIKDEIKSLNKLNTWTEVELPKGRKPIDTKWIFKIKENGLKKARLVAKGFQMKTNIEEIMYSPVARLSTIRMLLTKALNENLPINQLDIPTAFLNGEVKNEVYIKPPQGLKVRNKRNVLKLNKALYGLIESPKRWNETLDIFLKKFKFKRSEHDYCLYMKEKCWLLIYVDDILV